MNQILEMREKRVNLWNAAKAFLDTGQRTARFCDSGYRTKDGSGCHSLGKEAERLERQEVLDLELTVRPPAR